jgi:predicted Na+-dependent transporter
MQSNLFTAVLLPLALAMIMLGMGLSLVPEDFKRISDMAVPAAVYSLLMYVTGFGAILYGRKAIRST